MVVSYGLTGPLVNDGRGPYDQPMTAPANDMPAHPGDWSRLELNTNNACCGGDEEACLALRPSDRHNQAV